MFPTIITGQNLELRTLDATDENASLLSDALTKSEKHRSKYLKQLWNFKCGSEVKKQLASRQSNLKNDICVYYGVFEKKSGKLIGETAFIKQKDSFACTAWIDEDFTGHGYMQEALQLSEKAFFESGHTTIQSYVRPSNAASKHVFEKQGYKNIGKDSGYIVFQKRLADFLKSN